MDNTLNFLLTILYNGKLLKTAIKLPENALPFEDPGDEDNLKLIHSLLPPHIAECGPIVAIEEIFDVTVIDG